MPRRRVVCLAGAGPRSAPRGPGGRPGRPTRRGADDHTNRPELWDRPGDGSQLADRYRIDPRTTAHRARLARLLAVLAARHAVQALERVHTDPATATKSTFGAKLAAEARRLTAPAADNPGAVMLAFIETMNVGRAPAARRRGRRRGGRRSGARPAATPKLSPLVDLAPEPEPPDPSGAAPPAGMAP